MYLLDTHTFIWSILDSDKLSKRVSDILKNKDTGIYISTISFWEIAIKVRMHRYTLEGIEIKDLPKYAKQLGSIITLDEDESSTYNELSYYEDHKDPFDRMLIWQALHRKMGIISKDENFKKYEEDGLKVIW